ncbi:hypothetical protein [Trebonia sp.]|uniref:hypothetical protein n=1 Tax=Trebonia sp. TaxID=2767075 RepID=UPI002629BCE9|nr:hypothetical protein [Trebonia sp.]
MRITCHCRLDDPEIVCAALLHDAVEDHAASLSADGSAGRLPRWPRAWARGVADLVEAVTNPLYVPGTDPDQKYRDHVTNSLNRSPWARVIKVPDFTDNGVCLIHTRGPKALIKAASLCSKQLASKLNLYAYGARWLW